MSQRGGRTIRRPLRWVVDRLAPVLGLALVVGVGAALSPTFRSPQNLVLLAQQAMPVAIMAIGQTVVILSGGIDLSVGFVSSFTGVLAALWMTQGFLGGPALDPVVATLLALLVSAGIGLLHGLLVTRLGLSPFIVTLGSFNIFYGLCLVLTSGGFIQGLPAEYPRLYSGAAFGIPIPIGLTALLYIASWVVLRFTPWGRFIYAVGSNERAVRLAGINVRSVKVLAYTYCSFMAGIAGIVLLAKLQGGNVNNASGAELTAIAAVVIGGASLMGGTGSIWGGLIGALILAGTLPNLLVLLNVRPDWNPVVAGSVIVLAVVIDSLRQRRRSREV
jgi:ribose transport system permease protein